MMFKEPLYKRRSIGDKMDVTFGFLRENINCLFKNLALLSIPFCLLMAFSIVYDIAVNDIRGSLPNSPLNWDHSMTIATLIAISSIMDFFMVIALALTMVRVHYEREDGLDGIKTRSLLSPYGKTFLKSLSMPFAQLSLIVLLILIITCIGGFVDALIYHGDAPFPFGWAMLCYLIFLLVCLTLPAYCVGGESYSKSISKSFGYGFPFLFSTLAFTFCMFILCLLIFMWEIALVNFLTEFRHELIGSSFSGHEVAYTISWVVIGILWCFITLSINIALFTGTIGLTYHYGNVTEIEEHISLKKKISNFENL